MAEQEWTICTVHHIACADGWCAICHGDVHLVQVVPKRGRDNLMATLVEVRAALEAPLAWSDRVEGALVALKGLAQ